jgi:hypothetical protein
MQYKNGGGRCNATTSAAKMSVLALTNIFPLELALQLLDIIRAGSKDSVIRRTE